MHYAAVGGNKDQVRDLIAAGAELDAKTEVCTYCRDGAMHASLRNTASTLAPPLPISLSVSSSSSLFKFIYLSIYLSPPPLSLSLTHTNKHTHTQVVLLL
jgi:hypothetical protein